VYSTVLSCAVLYSAEVHYSSPFFLTLRSSLSVLSLFLKSSEPLCPFLSHTVLSMLLGHSKSKPVESTSALESALAQERTLNTREHLSTRKRLDTRKHLGTEEHKH